MTQASAGTRGVIRPAVRVRNCGVVLVLLAGAIVYADGEDEIARCARIPSVGDRIICLEDALRRADDARAPMPEDTLRRPDDARASKPEDTLRRPDDAHASMPEGTPGDSATASASDTDSPDEAEQAAAKGPADGAPRARGTAKLGLDESREQAEQQESIRVTVVAIEKSAYRKPRYITGDGQVWQQIDQRTPRYPDVPFPAEIRGAAAGSFFLQPLSSGVAVRVQRKR